jgi:MinD-like ATPase involved in chromosome partitioning or flagellar assembly
MISTGERERENYRFIDVINSAINTTIDYCLFKHNSRLTEASKEILRKTRKKIDTGYKRERQILKKSLILELTKVILKLLI